MKIILQQDIPKIGRKGEIKNVSDGYARNYLIKNKLAVLAVGSAVQEAKQSQEADAQKKEKELKAVKELAKKISETILTTSLKMGKDGGIFGSVNTEKISSLLAEKGMHIKKTNIDLDRSIKALGEHKIKIRLDHGITAELKIKIESN